MKMLLKDTTTMHLSDTEVVRINSELHTHNVIAAKVKPHYNMTLLQLTPRNEGQPHLKLLVTSIGLLDESTLHHNNPVGITTVFEFLCLKAEAFDVLTTHQKAHLIGVYNIEGMPQHYDCMGINHEIPAEYQLNQMLLLGESDYITID